MKWFLALPVLVFLVMQVLTGRAEPRKQGRQLIDSLAQRLHDYKREDTNRVMILCSLALKYQNVNYDTGFRYAQDALALALSLRWERGMAMAHLSLGDLYRNRSRYPEALEHELKALDAFETMGNKRGVALANGEIGVIFQYENKYDEAIKYESVSLNTFSGISDSNGMAMQLGNLATLYLLQQKYDSALSLNLRSLGIFEEIGKEREIIRTYGNIGMVCQDLGKYEQALEYHFKSLSGYRRLDDRRGVCIAYGNIGQVYLDMAIHAPPDKKQLGAFRADDPLARAVTYLDSAIRLATALGDLYSLQECSKSAATAYEMLGNYKSAYTYYQLYVHTKDSVFSTENKIKIARAEARNEVELLQFQIAKKKNERWFFISGIALLAIIGVLLISRLGIKQRRLKGDMEHAGAQLAVFRKNVSEKNLIIEQITAEIERIKGEQQAHSGEMVLQLKRSIILTDEQWTEFQALFSKVHKGFFATLRKRMPDLTQAEIRLLALTKLKLSSKEMAAMMGISPNTVRIYRHRLRRKLALDKEEMIEELVESI